MSDSFQFSTSETNYSNPERRNVLVTGAGGSIGSYFSEQSHEKYDLTMLVHSEENQGSLSSYGRVEVGDMNDLATLKDMFQEMDTVVHLAARASPSQAWGPLLESNIVGTYNVFVAAKAANCRRVIFASSIHAISGYTPDRQVQTDDPVNPGDLYGVTKCFGEAMGRFMATQQGLSTICIRIGAFQPIEKAKDSESLGMMNAFVSHRDLNQLLHRCIDDERLQFAILHGLSNNRFNRMNISDTRELVGYCPEDDFTEVHPDLKNLHLREKVLPHSEVKDRPTGIRNELE